MLKRAPHFHYREGALHCEEVSLKSLVETFKTPAFVYSQSAIERNCRRLKRAFQDLSCDFFYAVKANSNLRILRLIADQGFGFDVVSGGELQRLLSLGIPGNKILFSGVGKTPAELELARSARLRSVQAESLAELRLLAELSRQDDPIQVGLRINPRIQVATHPYVATGQVGHKFGIQTDQVPEARSILKNSRLELVALGSHVGSQIQSPIPYMQSLQELLRLTRQLAEDSKIKPALDLGGGFCIPYREGDSEFDFTELASQLSGSVEGHTLFFEPGRSIIGSTGALLTRILYRKSSGDKQFLVCDAAMNDLLRPALYDARHQVVPLHQATSTLRADLVGPVCESGDFLSRDGEIPDAQPGEALAVLDAGAYGFCLSCNYNSRLRAPEILIDGDQIQLIRRRETFHDLVRCEVGLAGVSSGARKTDVP